MKKYTAHVITLLSILPLICHGAHNGLHDAPGQNNEAAALHGQSFQRRPMTSLFQLLRNKQPGTFAISMEVIEETIRELHEVRRKEYQKGRQEGMTNGWIRRYLEEQKSLEHHCPYTQTYLENMRLRYDQGYRDGSEAQNQHTYYQRLEEEKNRHHHYREGYYAGYQEGRDGGFQQGMKNGHQYGHGEGYRYGFEWGKKEGDKGGQERGYSIGYKVGMDQLKHQLSLCKAKIKDEHDQMFFKGHKAGRDIGRQQGFQAGLKEGYKNGHSAGRKTGLESGKIEGQNIGRQESLTSVSPYEVLGLSNDASIEDVRLQFKQLSLVLHPDKGGSSYLQQLLTTAYVKLSKEKVAADERVVSVRCQ